MKMAFENRLGMSLPEVLVSIVLVGLLLTFTFYLFTSFFTSSFSEERKTLSQTDVQLALFHMKWDILMAGFGVERDAQVITCVNGVQAQDYSDIISLVSCAFGSAVPGYTATGTLGRWSYILAPATNSMQLYVRRWNDSQEEINKLDYIVVLSPDKYRIGATIYQVTNIQSATVDGIPAWNLTLNAPITTGRNFVYVTYMNAPVANVSYSINNGNLMRAGEVILEGAEDLQFLFWVDTDGDGIQDSGEIFENLSVLLSNPALIHNLKLIHIFLATSTKESEEYINPQTSLVVGPHTKDISAPAMRKKKYTVWPVMIHPRNLL